MSKIMIYLNYSYIMYVLVKDLGLIKKSSEILVSILTEKIHTFHRIIYYSKVNKLV